MFEWETQRLRKYLPISIIVPTYNRANYLLETLNAILAQQDQDLEVIVVDDSSTDDSRNVLESFKKRHPQIVLVFLEENLGESNAVNVGWLLASKQFVSIVNSDDPPHENWLRDMTLGINEFIGFGFYYPNRQVIDSHGNLIELVQTKEWSSKILYERLVPIASAGMIIDRNHLPGDFLPRDKEVEFPSDLIQILNLGRFTLGKKISSAWGVWRMHEDSYSSKKATFDRAMLFERNVKVWLNRNDLFLESYSKPLIRNAFLYGNIWKILRSDLSFFKATRSFLNTSFLSELRGEPALALSILYVIVKYSVTKRVSLSSRLLSKS
jgi:glycosyltransferase involved in cell wall biosynthesis